MLRDFTFLRRNSGKKTADVDEEIENIPVNSRDSLASQASSDTSSRPPFNPIHDPTRTPKPKHSDAAALHHRTTPRGTRTVATTGRANSGYSETNSTQSTPTKSVSKPQSSGYRVRVEGSNGGGRFGNFAALYRGVPVSTGGSNGATTVVNSVEVPHFELKEDPSFWMDHNVQVLIRVRPLNSMERNMNGYNRCLKQESSQSITWIGQPETRFTFDHVACETIDQETLFRMAGLPMVENCLSGYNSSIFAYGQTGSGKTYTMLGEIDDLEVRPSLHRGMTPRIFEFLFARIQAEEEIRRDERLKYNCKCSFLEIYNEQITDLLDPSSTNLLLREDVKKGVYVENLSEFEVRTVGDILKLLIQGSLNRRVAATNMNRESSRSHSVFTCVIESRWEKDSTTNLRFARLNLVDLAGSERQKSSGAEGERLKEAANINKSLSTLGHVIMILVDVANGKPRHVPYRDSRLTFLLQDSLGGNSKTLIIANVSPSICCAAETMNTLKFAQRAKLIQNNAVVNEDSTGDVIALQNQIRVLKEELSVLKRQTVSRTLSFGSTVKHSTHVEDNPCLASINATDQQKVDESLGFEAKGIVRLSTKQLKSLETTLAGALRREQMAETSIKKLEAEIEQLNRLVRQREEDTRSTKMMLKFREDKIQRMESLLGGSLPTDTYLAEENKSLSEEIQLLQAKVDKNPEVTRFALENIRLLDQLRRYQEFYAEGEKEILLDEVTKLREQLLQLLDGNSKQHNYPNANVQSQETMSASRGDSLHLELKNTLNELEECRYKLNSCLEENRKLSSEICNLQLTLDNVKSASHDDNENSKTIKDTSEAPRSSGMIEEVQNDMESLQTTSRMKHAEEILDLHLELDILKIILKEERSTHSEIQKKAMSLKRELELEREEHFLLGKKYGDATCELKEMRSVIEALESQQILTINELEDLRNNNNHFVNLLSEKELEIEALKEQQLRNELRDVPLNHSDVKNSNLETKLKKMQDSFEKAKRLNAWYQNDHASQMSKEEQMDEVRRQVEAETAEVIICMQEELSILHQQVQACHLKEDSEKAAMLLGTELKELQGKLCFLTEDNRQLHDKLEQKEGELRMLTDEWELLACEMEEILADGQQALTDASDQLHLISSSFPEKRIWISEQVGRLIRSISEKEMLVEELRKCLEDANHKRSEVECMLKSLRGAALVINEAHQQEFSEKENEILLLKSQLCVKDSTISELEDRVRMAENDTDKASVCATVAFVLLNRLSEVNLDNRDKLKYKDDQLSLSAEVNLRKEGLLNDQIVALKEAEEQIQSLRMELAELKEVCDKLQQRLFEEENRSCIMERKLEDIEENDILQTREKVEELKTGVSSLRSCMKRYVKDNKSAEMDETPVACAHVDGNGKLTDAGEDLRVDVPECFIKKGKNFCDSACYQEEKESEETSKHRCNGDVTVILLKQEIESALESLQEVQVEMSKLQKEKEDFCQSERQNLENMKCLTNQILQLKEAFCNFEGQYELKIEYFNSKLQAFGQIIQESKTRWCQTKEFLEMEVGDAKIDAAQKAAEASCILAKFEEAQDTMKEADIMINELMIANETMKINMERLKEVQVILTSERDILINEIQSQQSICYLKDQRFEELEKQFGSNLIETTNLVAELEGLIVQVQTIFKEDFMSAVHDLHCLKALVSDSGKVVRSWLEDVWSEIIVKDCAVSVLHLCHMGVLLEMVTGLNAENGLLQHGLCESNSVITDLREHNSKSSRELQMCRTIKGKLLADIKSSYDRISRKEEETGELGVKLIDFEKKISDLQQQEEVMLQRSNYMGSQLAILMKELDLSNMNVIESLFYQEKLLKDKEELLKSEAEDLMTDLCSKDFESLILASHQMEMAGELNTLQNELAEVTETNVRLLSHIQSLEAQCEKLLKDLKTKETALENSSSQIFVFGQQNQKLQQDIFQLETSLRSELDMKNAELSRVRCLEKENKSLESEIWKLKTENIQVLQDLEKKNSEIVSFVGRMDVCDQENKRLQGRIYSLETLVNDLQNDLGTRKAEVDELLHCQSVLMTDFHSKTQDLQTFDSKVNQLRDKNINLSYEIKTHKTAMYEALTGSSLKNKKCFDLVENVHAISCRIFNALEKEGCMVLDEMFHEICESTEMTSKFLEEFECLELHAKKLAGENTSLQAELVRKDDVLKGLLFDLSLLQESASNTKDQKDKFEKIMASLEALEDELEEKSGKLEEAVVHNQMLEAQLQEKMDIICALQLDLAKACESLENHSSKNLELRAQIQEALAAKCSAEEELTENRNLVESLEMELSQMGIALGKMCNTDESLRSNLNELTSERDQLLLEIHNWKEKLEKVQAWGEENEAMALEAHQLAEARNIYAEDKEAEVKLLERSVEELECTVNVLENKVDILKGEAERQRLQREELEVELQGIKHQMQNVKSVDIDMRRNLDEKEKCLEQTLEQIQILEMDIANKDAEIAQCKGHISELTLHAEAQASQYKQKFKALEAMIEQVKHEGHFSHTINSSSNKMEKNAAKSRGSGSPFKCIGLGLAQQIKTERDEELTSARLRIEELESLAVSRQKEIFALNARLAAAESMTHDVIRDLLGVKLDMTNYASLLDNQLVKNITEKAQLNNLEPQVEEQEVIKLKQQLSDFVEERRGWLEEIDRRQAELVATQISLEKLRQREQLLKTENEMLKMESINHKKRVMELDGEVKKLSGQQNLQQRIHHHAKIKEENNLLKLQNEDLSAKVRQTEVTVMRVKEELAHYRAANGRDPCIDFYEEQRLINKLKETEDDRMQLAQKLLGLCTSLLKVAGITKPGSNITPAMAEEALEHIKSRQTSLERELQDLMVKYRNVTERMRLSELMPQASPKNSGIDENCQTPRRAQAPFLSALDR